jgi:hypothetical protein
MREDGLGGVDITRISLRNKIRSLGISIVKPVWADDDPVDSEQQARTDPGRTR